MHAPGAEAEAASEEHSEGGHAQLGRLALEEEARGDRHQRGDREGEERHHHRREDRYRGHGHAGQNQGEEHLPGHRCLREEQDAGGAHQCPRTAAVAQPVLDQRQQLVDGEREDRCGHAAEQDEHPVLRLQAGEDVIPEAGAADWRDQGGSADGEHRGGAHAAEDICVSGHVMTGCDASAGCDTRWRA